jgi:hypothetical protein
VVPKANLNGTTASNDSVVLDGATHNHDGVMQRTLRLFDELEISPRLKEMCTQVQ